MQRSSGGMVVMPGGWGMELEEGAAHLNMVLCCKTDESRSAWLLRTNLFLAPAFI